MKKPFSAHIERDTINNMNYRKVVYTAKHMQLVLMRLRPKEEIGTEVHTDTDQFFRFESGEGMVVINDVKYPVKNGTAVIVPCGSKHNVINTSSTRHLMLYTIYSPPEHKDGVVQKRKQDTEVKPRK
jgi:mannose-6-phosphate isomerase-like protein (cupin superfamily)